jgi:hypothetical protein
MWLRGWAHISLGDSSADVGDQVAAEPGVSMARASPAGVSPNLARDSVFHARTFVHRPSVVGGLGGNESPTA